MKKLIIVFIGFFFAMSSSLSVNANVKTYSRAPYLPKPLFKLTGDTLDKFRNDPDWQIMARVQYQVINAFVTNKSVDLENFDFTDEGAFLKVLGFSRDQYMEQVRVNKEAAQRFATKFNIKGTCKTCTLNPFQQISAFRRTLQSFRVNPAKYSSFSSSLFLGGGGPSLILCCGFWYYACCATCAISIEVFPVYLACCALCYASECCS